MGNLFVLINSVFGNVSGNGTAVLSGESGRSALIVNHPGCGIVWGGQIANLHILPQIVPALIVGNLRNDDFSLLFSWEYNSLLDLRKILVQVVGGIFEAHYHLSAYRAIGLGIVLTLQDDSRSRFSCIVNQGNNLLQGTSLVVRGNIALHGNEIRESGAGFHSGKPLIQLFDADGLALVRTLLSLGKLD